MTMTMQKATAEARALGERQVEVIASTGALDREGDRIRPDGWRLDNYLKNPVILFGHDYRQLPVARCVQLAVVGGALRAVAEFPPRGIYEFADVVHDLVKAGTLNAVSVGFAPLASVPNATGGVDFTQAELLEFSFVPVPANPEALVVARSKGLDQERLTAFLRGGTIDLGHVDERVVRDTLREVVGDEVRRRMRWAAAPDDAQVIELDDHIHLDPADVREATREALAPLIGAAVRRQLLIARGRIVDD